MKELITKLPQAKRVLIGTREIVKSINTGKVKRVIAAKNCPEFLTQKIPESVVLQIFDGDERELGIKIGKPFPVAMVGYEE